MLGGARLPTCLEVLRTYRARVEGMAFEAALVVQVAECEPCGSLTWAFKDRHSWCSPACEERERQQMAIERTIGQAIQQAARPDAEICREQYRALLRQAVDTGHFGA
jgi:hypothetical protein